MKYNKGFTLIELLVVIAIIGILASVVLASLSNARAKGQDAAVQVDLANARAQGELYYDSNSDAYTNICDTGAGTLAVKPIGDLVTTAAQVTGLSGMTANPAGGGTTATATCNNSDTAWAAEAPLRSGGMYCVDSVGDSKTEAGSFGTATVCS
jgi:prepilin-type N-terminal cleavage/methylation domain-containing protein